MKITPQSPDYARAQSVKKDVESLMPDVMALDNKPGDLDPAAGHVILDKFSFSSKKDYGSDDLNRVARNAGAQMTFDPASGKVSEFAVGDHRDSAAVYWGDKVSVYSLGHSKTGFLGLGESATTYERYSFHAKSDESFSIGDKTGKLNYENSEVGRGPIGMQGAT